MDVFLRAVAIFSEVVLLTALTYCVLNGARLTVFDLGIRPKYNRAIGMVLLAGGVILVIFFTAHLITFYPAI